MDRSGIMGQGSPAVMAYQYGTESYSLPEEYGNLDIANYQPMPLPHDPPQGYPKGQNLHRQSIINSGHMPMNANGPNLFADSEGGYQSYASLKNSPFYVPMSLVDPHQNGETGVLGGEMQYLAKVPAPSNESIQSMTSLGQFRDLNIGEFNLRQFKDGTFFVLQGSPSMVGRVISQADKPRLWQELTKKSGEYKSPAQSSSMISYGPSSSAPITMPSSSVPMDITTEFDQAVMTEQGEGLIEKVSKYKNYLAPAVVLAGAYYFFFRK